MNLSGLRAELRAMIDDDGVGPKLWSDAAIDINIDLAQREAAFRADLIKERFVIPVRAGVIEYSIDPEIYKVHRVLDAVGLPLTGTSVKSLDTYQPGWSKITGKATHFCHDQSSPADPKIILSRIPTASTQVTVEAFRYPENITSSQPPEIDERWQHYMLHWAAHLCLMRRDQDQSAPALAAYHAEKFEEKFGPPVSIKHLRSRNERTEQVTIPSQF